ncbi:membrane protein [Pandoraea terrae]|uniref:Membrane protein n=1 Tax=Pandoraea terrae TaxID=1537710 RepID=A0A5E4YDU5_9BURK|nr:TlpA disulfide reductase family protein [Pandoraea terrae]VVE46485.1 membrane protein [Pandoraea terrae]
MTASTSRPLPLGKLVAVVLVLAVAIAAYFAFAGAKRAPEANFTLLSGQKLDTKQLRGKVYLVNFWATSCVTCMKEMPTMVQTYEKYKGQGLEFVAVAMSYDPPMYVMNYAQSRQLPFKVAMDSDGSVAKQYGNVQLTPTTFVVDRDGKILKQYVGEPEYAELNRLLEKALAKQA